MVDSKRYRPIHQSPGHVGTSYIKHVVRDRFVGRGLEDVSKSRYHLKNYLDTKGNVHVNYSSYCVSYRSKSGEVSACYRTDQAEGD